MSWDPYLDLKAGVLRNRLGITDADELARAEADFTSVRINALHPFREGNGRTQRVFLTQLARDAGHTIRWKAMDPAVNVAASRTAHRGDNTPLRAMLDHLVDHLVDHPEEPADTGRGRPPAPRTPGDDVPPQLSQ